MANVGRAALAAGVAVLVVSTTTPVHAEPAQTSGRLVIIQAVPKQALDVTVDGRTVTDAAHVGDVVGPLSVSPGSHQVEFADASGGLHLVSRVDVASGSSSDIVVHLPAAPHGAPMVNSYSTPRKPIAPGKARVLIAHTATVAPADVRVDGQVVFRDIANGEYATADVAAGDHSVALLPAGLDTDPILGPLDVNLPAGTVTMVYAVGTPRDHSMNVISHTARVGSNGAIVPSTIDTGRAGLAAHVAVHPFRAPLSPSSPAESSAPGTPRWIMAAVAALLAAGALGLRRRWSAPDRPR
jgi:MYXO-CTERM domain-containing protein